MRDLKKVIDYEFEGISKTVLPYIYVLVVMPHDDIMKVITDNERDKTNQNNKDKKY